MKSYEIKDRNYQDTKNLLLQCEDFEDCTFITSCEINMKYLDRHMFDLLSRAFNYLLRDVVEAGLCAEEIKRCRVYNTECIEEDGTRKLAFFVFKPNFPIYGVPFKEKINAALQAFAQSGKEAKSIVICRDVYNSVAVSMANAGVRGDDIYTEFENLYRKYFSLPVQIRELYDLVVMGTKGEAYDCLNQRWIQ
jgi:hypothetical protein